MNFNYVPTTCPYCGCGCGLNLVVQDGKLIGVADWRRHPVNEGKLCPKGLACHEFVHSEERLTVPLIKKDGKLIAGSLQLYVNGRNTDKITILPYYYYPRFRIAGEMADNDKREFRHSISHSSSWRALYCYCGRTMGIIQLCDYMANPSPNPVDTASRVAVMFVGACTQPWTT